MNDRDELTRLMYANADVTNTLDAERAADVVWAAGWRKKPIREELVDRLRAPEHAPMYDHDERDGLCRSCPWPLHMLAPEDIADAILALMDGPTETGEK